MYSILMIAIIVSQISKLLRDYTLFPLQKRNDNSVIELLAHARVVIILQYINVSDLYSVNFNLIQ